MRYSDDDNRRNNVLEKERVVCRWRLTPSCAKTRLF